MSNFEYRPLTPNLKGIRLIHLLPKSAHALNPASSNEAVVQIDTRVNCTISHVSLDNAPSYQALSYSWGDASQRATILVDNALISVTKNLESALAHLTPDKEPLTLWIDALCINQDDEVEKTEQVQQMHQIYSRAASVVTWLGSAADNSDAAMEWIQQYGSLAHNFGIGHKPEMRLVPLLQKLATEPEKLPQEVGLREFLHAISIQLSPASYGGDTIGMALSRFFKRSYWTRIWVVQELVHAKTVQFVCGSKTVLEEPLNHSLRLLRNFGQYRQFLLAQHHQALDSEVESNTDYTRSPISMLKIRRTVGSLPLIYLLRTLRYFNATDPRDKVFALLNLAGDVEELGLRPDYQMSHVEVYFNTTTSLLKKGFFDVLSLCAVPDEVSVLPSWIPDFSRMSSRAPLQQRALKRGAAQLATVLQPAFGTSANAQHTYADPTFILAPTMSVSLQAKLIGRVERTGTPWEPQAFRTWLQELRDLSSTDSNSLEPDYMKAIWRTAVADQEARRGNQKPRMSDRLLEEVHTLLAAVDLDTADAQDFHSLGIGEYLYQMQDIAHGRRPFCTSTGHLGIGPSYMEPGDYLYVLIGAEVPYILRADTSGKMKLIGEAYAHGLMDGQVIKDASTVDMITLY